MQEGAGSAIGQGAGKLVSIDRWFPSERSRKWLLLCGASDPPSTVEVSSRRTRTTGEYLNTDKDIVNMERRVTETVGNEVYNSVRDLRCHKEYAICKIRDFAEYCYKKDFQPVMYYSGHGEVGTGDWCFFDGTIGLIEIIEIFNVYNQNGQPFYLLIISDACYSGAWADECYVRYPNVKCLSACREFQTANDFPDEGGELTLYCTSDKTDIRLPRTEPLYSHRPKSEFPLSEHFSRVNFTQILKFMKKLFNICLKSLCVIGEDQFYGLFETIGNTRDQEYFKCDNFARFEELAQESRQDNKLIKTVIARKDGTFEVQIVRETHLSQQFTTISVDDYVEKAEQYTAQLAQAGNMRIDACFYHDSQIRFVISAHNEKQPGQKLTPIISRTNAYRCWQHYIRKYNKPICCSCLIPNNENIIKLLVIRMEEGGGSENHQYEERMETRIHEPEPLLRYLMYSKIFVDLTPFLIFPVSQNFPESNFYKFSLYE